MTQMGLTHDYDRNETTTLIAANELAAGICFKNLSHS